MHQTNPVFPEIQRIRIGPADIDMLTIHETADRIVAASTEGIGGYVMTHNLDHLWLRNNRPEFARVSEAADLVVADGQPLVWISKVQGTPLPERVGGIDMFEALAGRAANAGRSLFLVGGQDNSAADAAAILVERHPNLKIAGAFSPPMGLSGNEDRLNELVQQVAAANPDIIAVGLPSMLQTDIAERFGTVLPSAWVLGVGVSFSFVTGEVSRAPRWVQKVGLEWVHRMIQQPELTKRYLVHDAPLALKLLAKAGFSRLRR